MEVLELRIGDWVIDTFNDKKTPVQVFALTSDTPENPLGQTINHSSPNMFQPIPLTPEVLEKCGFEYGENDTANFYVNGLFCVYLPGSFFKDGRIYFDQWFTVPLCPKHLHQLQNIIYFLSGEEINYKP